MSGAKKTRSVKRGGMEAANDTMLLSPAVALKAVRYALKGFENPKETATVVREMMPKFGYENALGLTPFSHVMKDGQIWSGVVCRERNQLMGSVFSNFDGQPFVIRGYPKIKYSSEAGFIGETVVCEEKVDGTNLEVFLMPNGELAGKTRSRECWSETSQGAWEELFNETGLRGRVESLLRDHAARGINLAVCIELYGTKNQGEFVTYNDVAVSFKVFDIIDQNEFTFLPREAVEKVCDQYALPIVKIEWQGILTEEAVQSLEASVLPKRTDVEGFVAKVYRTDGRGVTDRFFAKLKSPEIKEKCFTRPREMTTIPVKVVRKAVKKALDEGVPKEDAYGFAVSELAEEVEADLIEKHDALIRQVIEERYRQITEDACKLAIELFKKTTDKRLVLQRLAKAFPTATPGELFQAYVTASATLHKR